MCFAFLQVTLSDFMVEFATDHPGLMLTVYMYVNMNPDCWQMLLFQCSSALRMLKVFFFTKYEPESDHFPLTPPPVYSRHLNKTLHLLCNFFFFFTISTFFSCGQVPSRPNCAHISAVSRM